jgi:hypothetical protein
MACQAGSSQSWLLVGSCIGDGDDQPFENQGFDIGTPPDLSGSLNSLDATSSGVQSLMEKSTELRRMSDVIFGSDKADLLKGYSNFNTGAGTSLNPTYGDMLPTGISSPKVHSINPRQTLRDQAPGKFMSLFTHNHQASKFTSINASSEAACGLPSPLPYPNDFDIALRETGIAPGITEPNLRALSWLGLWISQNAGRLPPTKELKCLEVLAGVPGKELMSWLKQHVIVTSERHGSPLQRVDDKGYCRPRCLDSRPRKVQSGEPKLFECTNRCGKTFARHRKGDWARHERINFEGWACYVCTDILTRKEHLQKHLKVSHDIQDIQDIKLENHKRQLLDSVDRPCGFCRRTFPTWSAWLVHVAAHFEGSIRGRKWKMSDWKERKSRALGTGKKPEPSKGYHDDDDDDEDDDGDGDNNGDNDNGDNGGGSPLNSSYRLPHNASGVDPNNGAGYSFESPYTTFNRYSDGTKSREHIHVQRASDFRGINEVALIDPSQDLVGYMAALNISASPRLLYESPIYVQGDRISPMTRWLSESRCQEPWNSIVNQRQSPKGELASVEDLENEMA